MNIKIVKFSILEDVLLKNVGKPNCQSNSITFFQNKYQQHGLVSYFR